MNRIEGIFQGQKLLIGFMMCGDPDLKTSQKIINQASQSGLDMLALGIPFSDPTAEDEDIQKAHLRALLHPHRTDDLFKMMEELHQEVTLPILWVTYANIIYRYGIERFMKHCQKVGVEGLLLLDVPVEEKKEFHEWAQKYHILIISVIASVKPQRILKVVEEAEGYLSISMIKENTETLVKTLKYLHQVSHLPCIVSLKNDDFQNILPYCEGIMIDMSPWIASYGLSTCDHIETLLAHIKTKMTV